MFYFVNRYINYLNICLKGVKIKEIHILKELNLSFVSLIYFHSWVVFLITLQRKGADKLSVRRTFVCNHFSSQSYAVGFVDSVFEMVILYTLEVCKRQFHIVHVDRRELSVELYTNPCEG